MLLESHILSLALKIKLYFLKTFENCRKQIVKPGIHLNTGIFLFLVRYLSDNVTY